MDETRADHIITGLIDIIEREITYLNEHDPLRAGHVQLALSIITENLIGLDDG